MPTASSHDFLSPFLAAYASSTMSKQQTVPKPLHPSCVFCLILRTVSPYAHDPHREPDPANKRSHGLNPPLSAHLHLHFLAVHTFLVLIFHHHIRFGPGRRASQPWKSLQSVIMILHSLSPQECHQCGPQQIRMLAPGRSEAITADERQRRDGCQSQDVACGCGLDLGECPRGGGGRGKKCQGRKCYCRDVIRHALEIAIRRVFGSLDERLVRWP